MARPPIHGMTNTPTWMSWMSMQRRCYQPGSNDYDRYGGSGIRVCARWKGKLGFVHFLADLGPRPPGTQLDRKDGSKGYNSKNCKWSTHKQQQRNRSSNRIVIFKGEKITLVELSERVCLRPDTIGARLDLGWSIESATTRSVRKNKLSAEIASRIRLAREKGIYLKDLAAKFGVSQSQVHRICSGEDWPVRP